MRHVKLTVLLLAALLTLALMPVASADSIWYPENDFIEKHESECDFTVRRYFINSPKGYIDGLDTPGGRVIYQAENGAEVGVYATYRDWGCIGCPREGAELSDDWFDNNARGAWVPLEDLSLIYDRIAFEEDFAGELVPGDQAAVDTFLSARQGDSMVVWPYPNAERAEWAWSNGGWVYENAGSRGFDYTYTDPEGHLWGSCCLPEFKDVWICLDAPDAGDGYTEIAQSDGSKIPNPKPRVVSVRALPEIELYPAREPQPPRANYLPALLVLLAVVLSAAALWFFYGKKRNKGGTTCDTSD